MTDLTDDSSAQYKKLRVFTESGGIEVARTEARLQELRRRASAAKAWGFPHELLSPAGVANLIPYINQDAILAGLYLPTVGVVDSLRAGTLIREEAQELGALEVRASTEVLGIEPPPTPDRSRRAHDGRRVRDRCVRHLLRSLEPACRPDGGCLHPPRTGRAPDDQRRAYPTFRRYRRRNLFPDHPRHGHQHVRAPARRRHGSGLVCAPADRRATQTRSLRSNSQLSRRQSSPSHRTTSTPSSKMPSSSCPRSSVTRKSASVMPSTDSSR